MLPICKFYSLNQTCRFGNHCRYSHAHSQRPPPFSKLKLKEDNGVIEADSAHRSTSSSPSIDQEFSKLALASQNDFHIELDQAPTEALPNQPLNLNDGSISHGEKRAVCPFFARGWCRYGRNCRLSHILPSRSSGGPTRYATHFQSQVEKSVPPRFQASRKHAPPQNQRGISEKSDAHVESLQNATQELTFNASSSRYFQSDAQRQGRGHKAHPQSKICAYFKAGHCTKGRNCKFSHGNQSEEQPSSVTIDAPPNTQKACVTEKSVKSIDTSQNVTSTGLTRSAPKWTSGKHQQRPFISQLMFTLDELEESGIEKVRTGEITAIKRRFPKDKIDYTDDGAAFVTTFKFVPSDPDWPFDVREFELTVSIPSDYPKETLHVTLPLDQDLPATVRRYIEVSIQEWVEMRHAQLMKVGKVELLFRPFLRWLDRNIEDITTEALKQLKRELTAKAAGFEFIPAQKLQARFQTTRESSGEEGNQAAASCVGENEGEEEEEEESDDDHDNTSGEEDSETTEEEADGNLTLELQPQQKGTEVSLKNLQLKEKAAALLFQRLKVVLQCSRCKNHEDVYVTQSKVTSLSCSKCSNSMYINYRPSLMHQFSSVLGYLDVDGCHAFDLVFQDCRASVSCMGCSKQTVIDGLVTGQVIDGWCKACNAKFRIATESVKMTNLVSAGVDISSSTVVEVAKPKVRKPPKDPSIREGMPLPNFGTCKHYKQSYRWLRFPCCGKAYPCDICHDKNEDHEMSLANRMICGHCCKEQNYSASRPCIGCGEHMTKIRSAHWEGGSGCRDKISMSKGDTQKYKNMNKTISNKKKLDSRPKKKSTKLRHV